MKRVLPSAAETAIFAVAAIIFSVIVNLSESPEVRLAMLSMPLFFVASLMGFRRYRLARVTVEQRARITREESDSAN